MYCRINALRTHHPSRQLYRISTIISRIYHAVVSIVHRKIRVTSPRRERMRLATTASHGKSKNKHHDLSTAVHGRRDEVVVLDEQRGVVLAEVELADESHDEEHGQGAVDADEQVAHVPEDDRGVDVAPVLVSGPAVGEVCRDWDDEADQEGQRDPLVARADAEHLAGYAPGDGEGVELLYVLAGPDVGALDRLQDLALVLDDRDHHDPIYEVVSDGFDSTGYI